MKRKRKRPKKHKIILEEGKFYNVHDRSCRGHPGRIEKADYNTDCYLSVTTHSLSKEEYFEKKSSGTLRNDFIELKEPTSVEIYKSFVNKRLFWDQEMITGIKNYWICLSKRQTRRKSEMLSLKILD